MNEEFKLIQLISIFYTVRYITVRSVHATIHCQYTMHE